MRPAVALIVACTLLLSTGACSSPRDEDAVHRGGSAVSENDGGKPAELRHTPQFILERVLENQRVTFDAQIPFPEVRVESRVSLKEFQDDIEPQWGFRPDAVVNAYIVQKNVIYLTDDASYYQKVGRFLDDSLAHELTHYVQVKYKGWDLAGDDSLEANAVDVQTWFRETYCRPQ